MKLLSVLAIVAGIAVSCSASAQIIANDDYDYSAARLRDSFCADPPNPTETHTSPENTRPSAPPAIASFSLASGTPVKMNEAQVKAWSVFLSNFSEVKMKPFKRGSLTDQDLIEFGLAHNEHNNEKLFKRAPAAQNGQPGAPSLASRYVAASAAKYFGVEIRQHQSTPRARYDGNENYTLIGDSFLDAEGDVYSFSHITRLVSLGNNLFAADADVYTAPGPWDQSTTSDPKLWKDTEDYDPPTLDYSVRAIVQKVTSGAQSHLILLEYQRIPTGLTPRLEGRRWLHTLRDSRGQTYTCFFVANDESRRPYPPGTKFIAGKMAYTGHYQIALIAPGQTAPVAQSAPYFSGTGKDTHTFDPKNNNVYVVPGKNPGQPDLLVYEEDGSAPANVFGSVFFIADGKLQPVRFKTPGGAYASSEWMPHTLQCVGSGIYKSIYYNRAGIPAMTGTTREEDTWRLNLAACCMTQVRAAPGKWPSGASSSSRGQAIKRIYLEPVRCYCNESRLHGTVYAQYADGTRKRLTSTSLAADPQITSDHRAFGWIEGKDYNVASYGGHYHYFKERIVLYRDGKKACTLQPAQQAALSWQFLHDGQQVAVKSSFFRGKDYYQLFDASTGRQLASLACYSDEAAQLPEWTRITSKPNLCRLEPPSGLLPPPRLK